MCFPKKLLVNLPALYTLTPPALELVRVTGYIYKKKNRVGFGYLEKYMVLYLEKWVQGTQIQSRKKETS